MKTTETWWWLEWDNIHAHIFTQLSITIIINFSAGSLSDARLTMLWQETVYDFYLARRSSASHISHSRLNQHQICIQSCVIIYLKTHISAAQQFRRFETGFFSLSIAACVKPSFFISYHLHNDVCFPTKLDPREREISNLEWNRKKRERIISPPLISHGLDISKKILTVNCAGDRRPIGDDANKVWINSCVCPSSRMCWCFSLARKVANQPTIFLSPAWLSISNFDGAT